MEAESQRRDQGEAGPGAESLETREEGRSQAIDEEGPIKHPTEIRAPEDGEDAEEERRGTDQTPERAARAGTQAEAARDEKGARERALAESTKHNPGEQGEGVDLERTRRELQSD